MSSAPPSPPSVVAGAANRSLRSSKRRRSPSSNLCAASKPSRKRRSPRSSPSTIPIMKSSSASPTLPIHRPDRTPGHRRASRDSLPAAHRRRSRQRQSQAQQYRQGLESGAAGVDCHRRFQRAHAARLYPAADEALARRHRHRLCAAAWRGPENFAAEIECAFLNTYQARWQYSAEALGFGFAQGKTMLWRRDILETGGGIEALGAEIRRRLDQAGPSRQSRAHLASPPSQHRSASAVCVTSGPGKCAGRG